MMIVPMINLLSGTMMQERKAQKAQIKEELIPVPWHPSRWWDWCVPNDEKKESEKL